MSDKLFGGAKEEPDTNFWPFVQEALLSSLAITMIYFLASIIADIAGYYINKGEKDVSLSWPEILQHALARSIYSFTSSVLLYAILY